MEAIILIISSIILCCLILLVFMIGNKTMIKITEDKVIDLNKVIPIHAIEDDFIISGNGDLTIGYKLFLPEVFSLTDKIASGIHESLYMLLKMLPAGTIVHQQAFIYTSEYSSSERSDNILFNDNLKNLEGKAIINMYINIYLTFQNGTSQMRKDALSTSLLKKANYPFKKPIEIEKRIDEILPFILNFENGLMGIDEFDIIKINSQELNNAIFDYVNLSYNQPTKDATKEVVNPMGITSSGNLKIGNKLVSILSLIEEGSLVFEHATPRTNNSRSLGTSVELPEGILSKCGMMYPLTLGLPFDHIVNVIIEITDVESTLTALGSEKRNLNLLTQFYAPAKTKQNEIDKFTQAVAECGYQTSYTGINVIISDTDKTELSRKEALAKKAFADMNQSTSYLENQEVANLFFASIPGNARANYRGFTNTVKQALCYFIKESLYISSKVGHIFHDRFGTPVHINLWDRKGLDNRNRICIGPSGSGKSFWVNNYALQSYIKGNDVVIIDIGGSYQNFITVNAGKYYDSTNIKNFKFNPFICPKDKFGAYRYLDHSDEDSKEDLIKTIAAVISFIWKEKDSIKPIERVNLTESIKAFYEHINKENKLANLINYRDFLPKFWETLENYNKEVFNIHELSTLLKPYTEGELNYLLNAEEGLDITNDTLIGYDMESISKEAHFPIVAILTLQVILDKIKRRKGVPKTLIIDEAFDFLKDEKFGEFIGSLFRTFRKKEGEILIAAQNINFIKNASKVVSDSIIINCDTKIILEHGSKYWDNLKDLSIISISDDEIEMIKSLQRKEKSRNFFIKLGNDSFVLDNGVSDLCASAFDSRQSTVVEIQRLFRQKGSMYAALNQYVENTRSKLAS